MGKIPNIAVYGFEEIGFSLPSEPVGMTNSANVQFVKFDDASQSFEMFDGVILPQGIFESFSSSNHFDGLHAKVNCKKDLLLERERQVINLMEHGKWICILLIDSILDAVPQGHRNKKVCDTDLCKRLLNEFQIRKINIDPTAFVLPTQNEFIEFIREYGVAKTLFWPSDSRESEFNMLAKFGDAPVAFELQNKFFALPFHTTKRDAVTLTAIAKTLVSNISDYRQKHCKYVPDWLNDFHFAKEEDISNNLEISRKRTADLEAELEMWRDFKSVLTTSNDILKNEVVCILKNFFKLEIDSIDKGCEDAKIISQDGSILALLEVKGCKGGVTLEHLNQVNSHVERNGLPPSTPGVLLINNQMNVVGIEARLLTTISDDHIAHAKKLNVTIVRTIDLLFLMKHLESHQNRGAEIVRLLCSGGGWLKADHDKYSLLIR